MAMTFIGAVIAAASIGTAIFGGLVPPGALTGELLTIVLALVASLAVISAAALDS